MRPSKYFLPAVLILTVVSCLAFPTGVSHTLAQSKYIPVTRYDPKRDAARDIQDAVKEAQRAHKRILLEVGGEWCSWCHTLDRFFDTHAELIQLRDKNFVTVKINFSEENTNKDVLSRYEAIPGYPHIFVLDSDGKLLWSQNTSILERDKSYDLERLTVFLTNWAPASKQ